MQRGGWLRTGDAGFVRNGEVFITSRLKDVLVVGGRKLSPTDLEWTVQSALPQLRPGCLAAFAVTPHERQRRHDGDSDSGGSEPERHEGGDGSLPGTDAVVLVAEVRDAMHTRGLRLR
jgi:acyl-CoA synthetase (AMP-forming)/AMP-acid ligase II